MGIMPDTNRKSPQRIAWEYGPIAFGAPEVLITSFVLFMIRLLFQALMHNQTECDFCPTGQYAQSRGILLTIPFIKGLRTQRLFYPRAVDIPAPTRKKEAMEQSTKHLNGIC
jgi:hypothetical protein